MATKPTTTYTWDTNQTNSSQPSSSLRTDGYAVNDIPTSPNVNYQLNSIYQWLLYFETVTDALDSLMGVGDITATFDSDGTSTTNAFVFKHDNPGVEVARINESANFLLNQATAGTSGVGVIGLKNGTAPSTQPADVVQIFNEDFAAGDSRLSILSESGSKITIGNNAIRNPNSDGTLIIASEKHITVDIDSDNDGTDGTFVVRANGSTTAMTVTEAGVVTASNITATNSSDISALAVAATLNRLVNITSFTNAAVTTIAASLNKPVLYASGGGSNYLLTIATGNDIVRSNALTSDMSLSAGLTFTSINSAVNFNALAVDSTFSVGVAPAGALYTSPASGGFGTYTSRTSGTANSLGYLSVGGGFWIAYGDGSNNTIRYNDTTDPTDAWSGSTSGLAGTTAFVGAAFGAGLHVAITTNNEIITTADPSGAWTSRTNPTTGTWHNMVYDGVRFWAVGNSGKIITSTDGITWTDVSVSGGGTIANAWTVSSGGQTIYICAETNNSSIRWGTTLGSWTILPIDTHTLNSTTGIAYFVYISAIKRLFIGDANNDLAFSKAHT